MKHRFEGWYFKHHANDGRTLALIPGCAGDGAFVQVVTDGRSYCIPYAPSEYRRLGKDSLSVGGSAFSPSGVSLDIRRPELTLTGGLSYADLTPVRGDIMGPFRFFPMECRHGVVSMKHGLRGTLALNGEPLDFNGGTGYIESDSGRSFPKGYTWVHCNDFARDCSIMAASALIPFCGLEFRGCICVVRLDGREYRLATYNGAKTVRCEPGTLKLRRGKLRLTAEIDVRPGQTLAAPNSGMMSRAIRETLSCPARFRFWDGPRVLFDGTSGRASYEWGYL